MAETKRVPTLDEELLQNHEHNGGSVTRGQKVKAHFGKWWWAYLIALIVVVLVVVLPIVYVAYPKIARDGIASSKLVPTSEAFLNPDPNSFDLELDTVLESKSSFHPNLQPFNGSLYLDGGEEPFAYIDVPGVKGKNGTVAHVSQRVVIANDAQFNNFCVTALSSETYTLRLKGKGNLKLGGLPSVSVTYDQPVESKGLNGFAGLSIETFFLQTNASLPYGANSNGTVLIPNPSVLTLAVGDASFNISLNGTHIGNATIPNLTLKPGNHTYSIDVQSELTAVLALLKQPAYQCAKLPVDIVGIESVYNGQVLPYFSNALKQNSVRTMLDLVPALKQQGLETLITGDCT